MSTTRKRAQELERKRTWSQHRRDRILGGGILPREVERRARYLEAPNGRVAKVTTSSGQQLLIPCRGWTGSCTNGYAGIGGRPKDPSGLAAAKVSWLALPNHRATDPDPDDRGTWGVAWPEDEDGLDWTPPTCAAGRAALRACTSPP